MNEMKRPTLQDVADKLYQTILSIPGAMIQERMTQDNGWSHFVSFRIPDKGYWVVWTNKNIIECNGWLCLKGYQLYAPIFFANAEGGSEKYQPSFCSDYTRLCRESTNLIGEYSSSFCCEELPLFIEFARQA